MCTSIPIFRGIFHADTTAARSNASFGLGLLNEFGPKLPESQHGGTRKPKRGSFLVASFKEDMSTLVGKLNATHQHFVCCFRPNTAKCSQKFEGALVQQQVQCQGIVEALQVRQSGWPYRISYNDFYGRYKEIVMHIADPQLRSPLNDSLKNDVNYVKLLVRKILSLYWALNPSFNQADREQLVQCGMTMVCMRKKMVSLLESNLTNQLRKGVNASVRIQSCVRCHHSRSQFTAMVKASKFIQTLGRRHMSHTKWCRQRSAGLKLQTCLRRYVIRQRFKTAKCSAAVLQKWWRGEYAGPASSVSIRRLQSSAKRLLLLHHLQSKITSTVQIQFSIRRFLARLKLKRAQRLVGRVLLRYRSWLQFRRDHPLVFAAIEQHKFEKDSIRSVLMLQSFGRSMLAKRQVRDRLGHVRLLQKWVRARLEYEAFHWKVVSVIFIQSLFRSWKAVSKRRQALRGLTRLQHIYVGRLGRRRYQSVRVATIVIQKWCRGVQSRHDVERLWAVLPRMQALIRRKIALLKRSDMETDIELLEEMRNKVQSQANENETLHHLRDIVLDTCRDNKRRVPKFVGFDDWHASVKRDRNRDGVQSGSGKSSSRASEAVLKFSPGALCDVLDVNVLNNNVRKGYGVDGFVAFTCDLLEKMEDDGPPKMRDCLSGEMIASPKAKSKHEQSLHISSLACGARHHILLDSFGRIFAYGTNEVGQLGIGSKTTTRIPDAMLSCPEAAGVNAVQVPVPVPCIQGPLHLQKPVLCYSRRICSPPPAAPKLVLRVTQVACGEVHSVCVCENGVAFSWGGGRRGQLGHGNNLDNPRPQEIKFVKVVKRRPRSMSRGRGGGSSLKSEDSLIMPPPPSSPLKTNGSPHLKGTTRDSMMMSSSSDPDVVIRVAKCGAYHTVLLSSCGQVLVFGAGATCCSDPVPRY